jgi:7,8-dihydropterin-6-yl-methyl-4-(beta-D-ribofuranosyl)aminobenzene 5'-phosphate synthase
MAGSSIAIRILVDNSAVGGLRREHGFSAWIETSGHRLLFDTGQSETLIHNAAALGCDLSRTEALVLSHGHYDHTGGLAHALSRCPSAKVYCHARVVQTRYSIRESAAPKEISMPPESKAAILNLPAERIAWCSHPERMYPAVGLSGPIPALHPLEKAGAPFFLDIEGIQVDRFEDEIALWIQSDRGLVVMTGCGHSGLISTIDHVRRISDQQKVCAVIGGFHLRDASLERLEATVRALREWDIETVIPCHCTGENAIAFLKDGLGGKVIVGYAGLEWKNI